jgi:predicted nucleic acid-binding protein
MTGYMLDTNVFDRVVKGKLALSDLPAGTWYVTHLQGDELNNTQDDDLRKRLREMLDGMGPETIPTHRNVIGLSKIRFAKIASDSCTYQRMLERLKKLDRRSKAAKRWNQETDIVIAETAIMEGHTLVTGDLNLSKVAREFGGSVLHI